MNLGVRGITGGYVWGNGGLGLLRVVTVVMYSYGWLQVAKGVTGGYEWLRVVTGGYRGYGWFGVVTSGYGWLHVVTGGYGWLCIVTVMERAVASRSIDLLNSMIHFILMI